MDLPQKKSEQSENERVVLVLGNHNTKTKSETLGSVKLKYISYDDSIEFVKILQEPLQDKDFVAKILFHQLVNPKISFDDFQKLSDVELEALAKAFVKNGAYIFQYFQDTGNYFKDFKQALAVGQEKHEELRKAFESLTKPAHESYKRLAENIANITPKLPKIDIPKFQLPEIRTFDVIKLPPNHDIVREQNAWERHKEILDVENAVLGIQSAILKEQKSTTKLTQLILFLTILGIIVTVLLSLILSLK